MHKYILTCERSKQGNRIGTGTEKLRNKEIIRCCIWVCLFHAFQMPCLSHVLPGKKKIECVHERMVARRENKSWDKISFSAALSPVSPTMLSLCSSHDQSGLSQC